MSVRCQDLGIQISLEACGPATIGPLTGNALNVCGQATAFCPTASAPEVKEPLKIDFEPLRAQMRRILGH
jgi:hypothetical protein